GRTGGGRGGRSSGDGGGGDEGGSPCIASRLPAEPHGTSTSTAWPGSLAGPPGTGVPGNPAAPVEIDTPSRSAIGLAERMPMDQPPAPGAPWPPSPPLPPTPPLPPV